MSCPLSSTLSNYKHIFGIPFEGVHQYRFLDTAIVDYVLSLFLAMIITKLTKIPLVLTTIGVLILGIISHIIFGIQTNTLTFFNITCK